MSNETKWSTQQRAIFDHFADRDRGNLTVQARAGTGKTTTILRAIDHAPEERILLAAFNKRIATELADRLTNPRAEAKTLHSLGFGFVRRYWQRVRIDARKRAQQLSEAVCGDQAPDAILECVGRLHTKAREMNPWATADDIRDLAFEFELEPDPEWDEDGYDLDYVVDRALEAMERAAAVRTELIDFADMLYLPLRNRWVRPTYDLVVVDEAQDMNAAQLALATRACRGRMVVVGDDRQAIYGFRGADSDSLDRLERELRADRLHLTTTYRCGRRIVAEAAKLVPDFRSADQNPEGQIRSMPVEQLAASAQVQDFILSRKNAPLAAIALRILRHGTRCRIEGKDLAAGLRSLVKKLAKGPARGSMPAFLAKLGRWETSEIKRATKSGDDRAEERAARIADKADTLRYLADGLSGVPELLTRIEDLFAPQNGPHVVCSTVHKAKGLEADRVFVLRDTLYPNRKRKSRNGEPLPVDPKREREEQNIEYVAITRAREELIWVDGEP